MVTDVTEFKYGNTLDSVHKVCLSAILDLCDGRPVAYVIGDSNNNALVFETFDKAVKANPGAHPIFTVTEGISVYLPKISSEIGRSRNGTEYGSEGSPLYR